MERLHNRVALVTGGASGLGRAIAQRLATDGATVVITDIQAELGRATAKEPEWVFLEQDVCDEARWPEVIGEIDERFGHLDILVNNAGILGPMDAANPENTRLADWRRIFAVNVEGVFLGCREAIPAMKRMGGGSIINISSIAGLRSTPYATTYGASKAAVRQLTKSVAQYCAPFQVRCNSVHPGDVRTPLWDRQAEEVARLRGVSVEEIVEENRGHCPMGEFTALEDVAAAVAFLAADDARHVTGTAIVVDGGIVNCESYRSTSKSLHRSSTR